MVKIGLQNETTREEWLKNTLKKIPAGFRILDAGAGELKFKKYCAHLQYISQDFAQYDGSGDGKGLQTETWEQSNLDIVCDINSIPEPDNSFDAVMCIEVFEHLAEPVKAIQEFSRLLKFGGYLIITAPFCSLTHFSPYHFYSGFNRYFYHTHLEKNGFKILAIEQNGNYFEYLGQEIRRIPKIAKQYAGIRLTILARFALRYILKILERISKRDQGSDELLCYGYHILAKKKFSLNVLPHFIDECCFK